jgi:hypothetical protein
MEEIPLVGDEKIEDYRKIFNALVTAEKPADATGWLQVKLVADLIWEIRRERKLKANLIAFYEKQVVLELLKTWHGPPDLPKTHIYPIFKAADDAKGWGVDPVTTKRVDEILAPRGYPRSELLARAYIKGQPHIDAADRRIASYEGRWLALLRELERRNTKLSSDLQRSSSDIIDAEFSEAAE